MDGGGYPGQRQQQPQVVYVERHQAPRFGVGGLALAAGAGILGGGVLAEVIGDEDRDDRDDYRGYGDGDDFGGGGDGGGDGDGW